MSGWRERTGVEWCGVGKGFKLIIENRIKGVKDDRSPLLLSSKGWLVHNGIHSLCWNRPISMIE